MDVIYKGVAGAPACGSRFVRGGGDVSPNGCREATMAFLAVTDHPFYEGEAPRALPVEGATQAPIIAQAPVIASFPRHSIEAESRENVFSKQRQRCEGTDIFCRAY